MGVRDLMPGRRPTGSSHAAHDICDACSLCGVLLAAKQLEQQDIELHADLLAPARGQWQLRGAHWNRERVGKSGTDSRVMQVYADLLAPAQPATESGGDEGNDPKK
eukprot:1159586-Pelagomonas_calceolata.AAC.7